MRALRLGCCLAVASLLAACGWQLQGLHRIPERVLPLYLDLIDIHSPFAEALAERLHRAGITVTDDRNRAQTVLYVSADSTGHRVSTVSALNEPQQYEVYYNVLYRLATRTSGAANLLEPQALNASRIMSYDKTLALAKQREEIFLRTTLAAELADQVMRRLSMLPQTATVPVVE